VSEKEATMIEKIARRAGGFASTTALRWMGAGVDKVAEVTPAGGNESHKHGGRLVAGAAGALALLSSSKTVRTGLERGLLAASKAVRATPGARSNGNGSKDLGAKTRAELYELAKKADLPGRSGMSKDELAKALSH
jgi:hypothetical protein